MNMVYIYTRACTRVRTYACVGKSKTIYLAILDSYKSNLNSPFCMLVRINLNLNKSCICIYMLIQYINLTVCIEKI